MSRLNRGTGTLYRPTYRASDGTIRQQAVWWMWWMQYFVQGRSVRESTGTRNRTAAARLLAAKVGRVAEGRPVPPRVDKVTHDELAADLRRQYRTTGRRDLTEAEKRLRPLDAHFGGWLATAITPTEITRYIETRQAARLANGTINRELSILGTLFRLGDEHEKVLRIPRIRLLKEAAPRAGFFEEARYAAVRRRLRPDLQVACELAYTYGWRMLDEVLTLEKAQIDLLAGTVRLEPGGTKNDDARVGYLTPEGTTALAAQVERGAGATPRAHRPVRVPAPDRAAGRNPDQELPQSLGDGVPAGGVSRNAQARLPADGGTEPRERRQAREGRHDDHGPQDAVGVRSLPNRGAGGFEGGRREDRGAVWREPSR